MNEKTSCEFNGKVYPDNSGVCIGSECLQCSDGNWLPNQFQKASGRLSTSAFEEHLLGQSVSIGFSYAGEDITMSGNNSCEFKDKIYPNGSGVCIGDQCIQCYDGKWGPNQFKEESRKRNLGY